MRAQAGDASAFTQLVRDHQHAIYSLVLGIVRNTEDAGDIVQDVWVKVARHLPQLREPERFVPWLYRIARNCSMDFCNSRKKRPQPAYRRDGEPDEDSFDVPDSSTYVPEQELLSLDERRKVWEALGALSESDRTVLFLRESRELPYAEIARILGISCNAAEVRVFRARERFRKQFIEVEEAAPECNISPLQLGAYVDGELGDATQKMLERHIHSCTECTSRLTAIESGRVLYRGIGLFLMPTGLTASVLANLPMLGFASAATAAAGTGVAVAATGGVAATGAASGAAASTGAAATGAVATVAAGAGSSTFGAGVAAAVAAAAMTGGVAVEYAETSAPPAPPAAAVIEIAAPPAPPVAIVYEQPAPAPAQAPVVQAAIVVAPPAAVQVAEEPASYDGSAIPDPGASGTPARVHGDVRGSDGSSANERGRASAPGTVTAALTKDDRTPREREALAKNDSKNEKTDKSDKNDKADKSDRSDKSDWNDKSDKNDSKNDGGRGNDGGRDGGRDNDSRGNDSRGNDGGRDNDGGRGGHGR